MFSQTLAHGNNKKDKDEKCEKRRVNTGRNTADTKKIKCRRPNGSCRSPGGGGILPETVDELLYTLVLMN